MLDRNDYDFLITVLEHYKKSLEQGYNYHDVVISEKVDMAIVEYGIEWCERLISYYVKERNK